MIIIEHVRDFQLELEYIQCNCRLSFDRIYIYKNNKINQRILTTVGTHFFATILWTKDIHGRCYLHYIPGPFCVRHMTSYSAKINGYCDHKIKYEMNKKKRKKVFFCNFISLSS